MQSGNRTVFITALALLAIVCNAATILAITMDANGDDTASIPDFDGDGTIGFGDFVIFAGVFGARQGDAKYDATYDLNGDGEIGFSDFVIFAQNFGKDAPSPVVTIPDANLRAEIAEALRKGPGAQITVADMKSLDDFLYVARRGISDLNGLEAAVNLKELYLDINHITDLSPLSGLTNLTVLQFPSNNISDLSPLSGLTNLTVLYFGWNNISDLSPLSGLTNLERLDIQSNRASDLSPLEGLTNLIYMSLGFNDITDISPLAGLTNLTELWAYGNSITDVSPLAGLTNLSTLVMWDNNITDISSLAGLANLTFLGIGGNLITDVSPLADLTNLSTLVMWYNDITSISPLAGLANLTSLEIDGNPITDLSMLAGLTNLTHLGISSIETMNPSTLASILTGLINLTRLSLVDSGITDISLLAGLTNLTELHLGLNNITDISPLAGLANLAELYLPNNQITDLSPLAGLTNLTRLRLGTNDLTDVSALGGLIRLTELELEFNRITDVSPLMGLTGLESLELRGNPLGNASVFDHIPELKSRGVEVLFDTFGKGDYDIELVFSDLFNERQQNVLQYVARRWMGVITEDLPDHEFTEGWSGTCGDHSFEIPAGERIDDLRIYLNTFESEIATGRGQPKLLRDATHMPVLGCIQINLERANLLITGLHEVAHVLGFGTLWRDRGLLKDYSQYDPNADTHFSGPLAITAFNDAGGRHYAGNRVPVQQMDGAHWRNSVLENELMLPSGGGSLSAITVQSLADLGYGVDATQADTYTLPGAAGSKLAATIAESQPSAPDPVLDLTRHTISPSRNVDIYGQGIVWDVPFSILGDGRRTDRFEGAKRIWGLGTTSDLPDRRQIWPTGSPSFAEPKLTCGAALMNEPIYVVDPQGRIVRTINR